jgi:hypothetical protein
MVSGTYIITNTTASTAMPASIKKVEPVPTASAIERNVLWASYYQIGDPVNSSWHSPAYSSILFGIYLWVHSPWNRSHSWWEASNAQR